MIFVDTGAWFASVVVEDPDHASASAWLAQNREPLFTTDYIVDEVLTLLRIRGQNQKANTLGGAFFAGELAILYSVTQVDFTDAWTVFRQFSDKEWSFTDCTSKIVMEKQGITTAFSFDRHFRQFGTVTVVP
jgi:uncharacterized protein